MNITIIGTGNMAKGLSARLVTSGHAVTVVARDSVKGQAIADELNGKGTLTIAAPGTPISTDIVILATHYGDVAAVAADYDGFAGKTVIDITNPVDFNTFQLIPAAGTSGAEEIASQLPKATVVKAFNTIFAGTLAAGEVDGKALDVLVAGDDEAAKKQVGELVTTSGMRAVDVGPLAHARHLEGLALIHMSVQEQLGTGWMSSIKFLG